MARLSHGVLPVKQVSVGHKRILRMQLKLQQRMLARLLTMQECVVQQSTSKGLAQDEKVLFAPSELVVLM